MNRRFQIAILAVMAGVNANAYYFFTHYTLRNAPYNPVPEKFDLTALPNKTLTFYVADTGPSSYSGNDSFASVLSQIRQAAQAWNAVPSSDLRVAFGGVFSAGTLQNTPTGQVVFEDLPPGILGYGGPSVRTGLATSPNNSFFPIALSLMHLSRDLTRQPGPSYTDFFFLSTAHEMGHSLGLQHTFTGSAMTQATTRATSLARVIDADDVAGLSVLYPAPGFASQFGSISGRVQFNNGQPVHLASVVAIRSGTSAVSALTNPDGTFRIEGIAPGTYLIYAHPLPPTADVIPPLDTNGNPVNPSNPFTTTLYPGTSNFVAALPVAVTAGANTPNINFSVQQRASVPLYDVQVYSYINGNPVKPAYLNENVSVGTAAALGVGLGNNGVAAPGLNAQVLGGAANIYATLGYGDGTGGTYFAMYLQYALAGGTGPQHLIFTLPDFIYILPNAINLVVQNPPAINNISGNPDGTLAISGTGFTPESRFFLDGYPLLLRSIDAPNSLAVALPPPAAGGQRATAAVLNSDGQNSFFAQPNSPATFAFPAASTPTLTVTPASVPAGAEAMVDITGINTNFSQAHTTVGFGSSDIYVRRVFVLSPTHLQADIFVPAGAALTSTEISVISGFQAAVQPAGFQITTFNPRLPVTSPLLLNALSPQSGIYPGAIVSLFGANLSQGSNPPVVTFNGVPASILFASPAQINLQIPASLSTGPAVMALSNGAAASLPVTIGIESIPPSIVSVLNLSGASIDSGHAVKPGDLITVLLSGFADAAATVSSSRVQVSIGGVSGPVYIVSPYATSSNLFQVQTALPAGLAPGVQPVIVYLDGRACVMGYLFVAP